MPNSNKIYTVSQVNSLIKIAIEEKLPPRLIVRGQISDFKHHTSGHCYFSLKDEGAILPCVMWASKFKNIKFSPEDGMEAFCTGYIDVYTPGGKYQLYVDKLEPAGVGALQLAFEQMVAKLTKEGLFERKHKKAIPLYPMRIGILTSESGAALHDITDSIHSRWPCAKLFLYPVPVQGEGSAEKIAAALRDINMRNQKLELDVLIVGRGGGAMEDLWAFNEEVLTRAIFDSTIPVISAVGHEVDTTIADLVADARASTPTKAGVVAVPDMQDILGQLAATEQRLSNQIRATLNIAEHRLEVALANVVFRNPLILIQNSWQQLDELTAELREIVNALLAKAHMELSAAYEQIIRIEPHRLLGYKTIELNDWQNRTNSGIRTVINNCRMQLTAQENRLSVMNPGSVLQRGYSITTNKKSGLLVRTSEDVNIGDLLITELANKNLIESQVKKR
jgi:exodeoxyribonuclease VII large subunit